MYGFSLLIVIRAGPRLCATAFLRRGDTEYDWWLVLTHHKAKGRPVSRPACERDVMILLNYRR